MLVPVRVWGDERRRQGSRRQGFSEEGEARLQAGWIMEEVEEVEDFLKGKQGDDR